MVYRNSKTFKQSQMDNALQIIEERGHIYISGDYETKESILNVVCLEHQKLHSTTFTNYTRSKTGLPCCGKAQVSKKLTGRGFSADTIKKMMVANNQRPYRGGKPRRWREQQSYRNWRKAVLQLYNNECAVTGLKPDQKNKVVIHHIHGAHDNPDLIYVAENGIPILDEIHKDFHKKYGYFGCTLEDFQEYLINLLEQQATQSKPISSQANPEGLEGSETRVYDPARVMKLHERLEGYNQLFIDD